MAATLLILKAGETLPELRPRGDFEDWFAARLGRPGVRLLVARPYLGEGLPLARGLSGVLVTGAAASVYDADPWIPQAAGFLLGAASLGVPILGVCFGHQLVADAFGGKVMKNPRGRELGTAEVTLTEAGQGDPLFAGLGPRLTVQASHQDTVALLPPGGRILAENANSPVQALAVGEHVRGVQFHPEFDAELVRSYLGAEGTAEGLAQHLSAVRDSPDGRAVLENWMTHFVLRS